MYARQIGRAYTLICMSASNTNQAAWVAFGSLFSFGFGIISSMILSRYFSKGDYGTYQQVIYVYNILLVVFTLGLPRAYSYFLPRVEISEAKGLVTKLNCIFIVLGLVFSTLLFVAADWIGSFLNNSDLSDALRIFSIAPFFMLPTMGLEGVLGTYRQTMRFSFYTIITRIIKLICVLTPILFYNGTYKDALIGFVVSEIIGFILALYLMYSPVKCKSYTACTITYNDIFKFSIPLLFASIWGVLINSSDQFFVSRYFGKEVFAEFSNGNMDMPFVGMIISACSVVLSPLFSKLSNNSGPYDELFTLWRNSMAKSAMVIFPMVFFCMFFADEIMTFLYSEKYVLSASYFRIRLITNFFKIVAYGPLLINIGRVNVYSKVHMIIAVSIILLEYINVMLFNSPYAVSIVSAICHILLILIFVIYIAKSFKIAFIKMFPISILLKIVLLCLLTGYVTYIACRNFECNLVLKIILELFSFSVLYLAGSFCFRLDYKNLIMSVVRK